jgi:hypothetical protein
MKTHRTDTGMLAISYPPGFDPTSRGHGYRWPSYRVAGQVRMDLVDCRRFTETIALAAEQVEWIHLTGSVARFNREQTR